MTRRGTQLTRRGTQLTRRRKQLTRRKPLPRIMKLLPRRMELLPRRKKWVLRGNWLLRRMVSSKISFFLETLNKQIIKFRPSFRNKKTFIINILILSVHNIFERSSTVAEVADNLLRANKNTNYTCLQTLMKEAVKGESLK